MSRESLKKQLKNLDVKKLKLGNGKSVQDELRRHARILADCIMEELNEVYELYSPVKYIRSYDLYNSLDVDETVKVNVSSTGTKLSIGISFDNGVLHESFDGEMKNVAWLINDGFKTRGKFANVPMLGYRTATNYIEHGIEKYKSKVSKPFLVKLTKGTEITYF